jgi:hypothetical protein
MTHGAELRLGCHVQDLNVHERKDDHESNGQQGNQQEMTLAPVEEIFDRHGNSPFAQNFPGGSIFAGNGFSRLSSASFAICKNTQAAA